MRNDPRKDTGLMNTGGEWVDYVRTDRVYTSLYDHYQVYSDANGMTVYRRTFPFTGISVKHRDDGPAVDMIRNGRPHKEWWLNGKRHREDGPAIQNGDAVLWAWHGKLCTLQEWLEQSNKTDKEKTVYRLKYL
jgi:hypothetical protein